MVCCVLFQVRAFAEWPGAKCRFDIGIPDGEKKTVDVKIITTRVGGIAADAVEMGVVRLVRDALVVPCAEHSCLEILELQPLGKKVMRARDFCNGLRGQQILVSCSKKLSV